VHASKSSCGSVVGIRTKRSVVDQRQLKLTRPSGYCIQLKWIEIVHLRLAYCMCTTVFTIFGAETIELTIHVTAVLVAGTNHDARRSRTGVLGIERNIPSSHEQPPGGGTRATADRLHSIVRTYSCLRVDERGRVVVTRGRERGCEERRPRICLAFARPRAHQPGNGEDPFFLGMISTVTASTALQRGVETEGKKTFFLPASLGELKKLAACVRALGSSAL
jgi:hypothetical protein